MTLHLVFSSAGWLSCQRRLSPNDKVVLLGDGVYMAAEFADQDASVLAQDLTIRGLMPAETSNQIDYAELVDLCVVHHPVVSWKD